MLDLEIAHAQHIERVDKIIAAFQKMSEAYKANPQAVLKIEAFRAKMVTYRQNMPKDPDENIQRMTALRQEAAQIMQSLKK